MDLFICVLCGSRSTSLSLWMSHLRRVHESEDVTLSCPINGCSVTYNKVNSLCSHVYRKHRDCNTSASRDSNEQGDVHNNIDSAEIYDGCFPSSISHNVYQLLGTDVVEQKKKSSIFLLQLKEERMLTQVAVNDVVAGCRTIFEHTLCHMKAGVHLKLSQHGIEPSAVEGLNGVFEEINDPFKGIETPYLQDKFVSKYLDFIVSKKYFYIKLCIQPFPATINMVLWTH